jgi:hypothetical protein
MRILKLSRGVLAGCAVMAAAAAQADTAPQSIRFAVMRGDMQIGTNTIDIGCNGGQTNVRIVTHVEVGMAFVTLYRFDQTETEQWSNGHLQAMSSWTDDNGNVHRVNASNRQGKMVVDGDGQQRLADAAILPVSLWNRPLRDQSVALNPQDGSIVPLSVTDKGEADIVVAGRTERAHHFVIKTTYSQDVWYDEHGRLVRVELQGTDGSTIHYEPI